MLQGWYILGCAAKLLRDQTNLKVLQEPHWWKAYNGIKTILDCPELNHSNFYDWLLAPWPWQNGKKHHIEKTPISPINWTWMWSFDTASIRSASTLSPWSCPFGWRIDSIYHIIKITKLRTIENEQLGPKTTSTSKNRPVTKPCWRGWPNGDPPSIASRILSLKLNARKLIRLNSNIYTLSCLNHSILIEPLSHRSIS